MNNRTKITTEKVFLCSDLHIGHANILKYDNRPFANIREHDEKLLENWNTTVGKDDHVYFLGDWCFNQQAGINFAQKCNGKIFFILGNHDQPLKHLQLKSRFEWVKNYHELQFENQLICLMHYEIKEWNQCHRGSAHFFGHSHKEYVGDGKKFNVGINLIDYKPILLQDVLDKVKNKRATEHH